MGYREEFPDFDREMPTIDGFRDDSWHNDACPCLVREDEDSAQALIVYVDYMNPDLCQDPAEAGTYTLILPDDPAFVTKDLDAIISAIAVYDISRNTLN